MPGRRLFLTFFITSVFMCTAMDTVGQMKARNDLYRLKTAIDAAVNSSDKKALLKVKRSLDSLTTNREHEQWAYYYLGYANYRLSSLFNDMDEDRKKELLNRGIEQLEKATQLNPDFDEAWALLGTCYGMKATGLFSGMKYGPKSQHAIDRALQLTRQNPRVTMMNGISLLHKPGIVGGSVEKAIEEFKMAGYYFLHYEVTDSLQPEWGHAENYAWLAQAHIRQDNLGKAREAYREALAVNPDYYWVKDILLPELEQKLN